MWTYVSGRKDSNLHGIATASPSRRGGRAVLRSLGPSRTSTAAPCPVFAAKGQASQSAQHPDDSWPLARRLDRGGPAPRRQPPPPPPCPRPPPPLPGAAFSP